MNCVNPMKHYRAPNGDLIGIRSPRDIVTTRIGIAIYWPDGGCTMVECADDRLAEIKAEIEACFRVKGVNDPITEGDILNMSLLSINDICGRLGIGRSTLDRWRKIGLPGDVLSVKIGLTRFPDPVLFVGGAPRWDAGTINAWLEENKNKKGPHCLKRIKG